MAQTQYIYQPTTQVPQQIIYVDDPYPDPQYSQPHYVFVEEDSKNDNPKGNTRVYEDETPDEETDKIVKMIQEMDPDDEQNPKIRNVIVREEIGSPREKIVNIVHKRKKKPVEIIEINDNSSKQKNGVYVLKSDYEDVVDSNNNQYTNIEYEDFDDIRDETPARYVLQRSRAKEDYRDIPSKIDSYNRNYRPIGGDVEVFDEKVRFKAAPRIDTKNKSLKKRQYDIEVFNENPRLYAKSKIDSHNTNYVRSGGDVEIFNDPVKIRTKPKIDSHNQNYRKSEGGVQIFEEKINFDARPKIDARNHNYKKPGGDVQIFNEPLNIRAEPRINAHNPAYKKNGGDVQIFNEPLNVKAQPRIDANNPAYKKNGGDVQIFSQPLNVKAQPRIDAFNPNYRKNGGDVQIFNEPLNVKAQPRVDAQNPNYKKNGGGVQIFNEPLNVNARSKIDAYNLEYKKHGGDVQIFNEPLNIKAKPRVVAKNPDYQRSKGDIQIFNDPLNVKAKPKVDAYNPNYEKPTGNIKIINDPIKFKAEPRINALNTNYLKSGGNIKIFNEPLNVQARAKIDDKNINYERNGGNIQIFNKPLGPLNAKPKIDSNNTDYHKPQENIKIFNEPLNINAKPKVNSKVKNYKPNGGNIKIFDEPLKLNAKARIDNKTDWKPQKQTRKITHEPLKLKSKSRLDTWWDDRRIMSNNHKEELRRAHSLPRTNRDNLSDGFIEPNIKGAKSKINTWNHNSSVENFKYTNSYDYSKERNKKRIKSVDDTRKETQAESKQAPFSEKISKNTKSLLEQPILQRKKKYLHYDSPYNEENEKENRQILPQINASKSSTIKNNLIETKEKLSETPDNLNYLDAIEKDVSVSNRSLNKNRHKRRRYRTLNTGNISDESITFDEKSLDNTRKRRSYYEKEREIDVIKEPQPLKLQVGDYGFYDSNNAFYTMRPKQATVNNNIYKFTSKVGSIDDYNLNLSNNDSQSVITRHVSAVSGKARSANSATNPLPTLGNPIINQSYVQPNLNQFPQQVPQQPIYPNYTTPTQPVIYYDANNNLYMPNYNYQLPNSNPILNPIPPYGFTNTSSIAGDLLAPIYNTSPTQKRRYAMPSNSYEQAYSDLLKANPYAYTTPVQPSLPALPAPEPLTNLYDRQKNPPKLLKPLKPPPLPAKDDDIVINISFNKKKDEPIKYRGKFHYPLEVEQHDGTNSEPPWQNAIKGFYYRPKSALAIQLTEPLLEPGTIARMIFHPLEVNESLPFTEKIESLVNKFERPNSSKAYSKLTDDIDEVIHRVLFNSLAFREIPESNRLIEDQTLVRPKSSYLQETVYEMEEKLTSEIEFNALEILEKQPDHRALFDPLMAREKSILPNEDIYNPNEKADKLVLYNAFEIKENFKLEEAEVKNRFRREQSMLTRAATFYNPPDFDLATQKRVKYYSYEINENFQIEAMNEDNNLIKRPKSSKVDEANIEIDNATIRVTLNTVQYNELDESEKADNKVEGMRPMSSKLMPIYIQENPEIIKKIEFNAVVFVNNEKPNEEVIVFEGKPKYDTVETVKSSRVERTEFIEDLNEAVENTTHVIEANETDSTESNMITVEIEPEIRHDPEPSLSYRFRLRRVNWGAIKNAINRSHRRNDPYVYISSKVKSFENFAYEPRQSYNKIFQQKLKFNAKPKIDSRSNLKWEPPGGNLKIFDSKPSWRAESRLSKLIHENDNLNLTPRKISIFSEKLKWRKESKIKSLSDENLNSLADWNSIAHKSRVTSFENLNYSSFNGPVKIFSEKLKWNAESRIKPIFQSGKNYKTNQYEFKIPTFKVQWKSEPKIDSHNQSFRLNNSLTKKEWYSGKNIETFNVNFKDDDKSKTPRQWKSESRLNELDSEEKNVELTLNIEADDNGTRIKSASVDNLSHGFSAMSESHRTRLVPHEKLEWLAEKKIDTWNKNYIRKKEAEKLLNKSLVEKVDLTRRELPDVRGQKPRPQFISKNEKLNFDAVNKLKKDRKSKLENTAFDRKPTPENKPSWNANARPFSINQKYNPEITNPNEKRFEWDKELKKRANYDGRMSKQSHDTAMSFNFDLNNMNDQMRRTNDHDVRLPAIKSPNHKSTPFTDRHQNSPSDFKQSSSAFFNTPLPTERKIKKRTKRIRTSDSRMSGNFNNWNASFIPEVENYELTGSSLQIQGETKVRPLANMNQSVTEEKAKIRKENYLFPSLITPRSYQSNDLSSYIIQ